MDSDSIKTTSNERIRELLADLGISQVEFCSKTGIKPSALSNYLKGNRIPRQDALSKIADAYRVSPTWLMGYDVPKDYDVHTLIVHPTDDAEFFEMVMPYGRHDEYTSLILAADNCTKSQVWVAVDMLQNFAEQNRELEEYREKERDALRQKEAEEDDE